MVDFFGCHNMHYKKISNSLKIFRKIIRSCKLQAYYEPHIMLQSIRKRSCIKRQICKNTLYARQTHHMFKIPSPPNLDRSNFSNLTVLKPCLSYGGCPISDASRYASRSISSPRAVPHAISILPAPRRWWSGWVAGGSEAS